jgi:hypothetical protein
VSYKIEPAPMDLANMRRNGVRSISVQCIDCGHSGTVNMDRYPGHLPVKSFEGRIVCKCGSSELTCGRTGRTFRRPSLTGVRFPK